MKKLMIVLAPLVMLLASCGMSQEEKLRYSAKSGNAAEALFGESAITLPTALNLNTISPVDSFTVPALKKSFDPKELINESGGIANFYIFSSFQKILDDFKPVMLDTYPMNIKIWETVKSTTDLEIFAQIRTEPMSETEFVKLFVYLISKQPNGEPGKLLTSGYANIFHVRTSSGASVALYAGWGSVSERWYVHARGLDSWDGGERVFSRGNEPLDS